MIAFIIYLIAGNAEVNRGPFDLPEAESELTAGYHTEYSGMHFGLFYVAEFVNLFIIAAVATTIFLEDGCCHIFLARRIQCHHGLYTRIYLVLWQVILCSMVTNVDQMDISPSAY